MSDQYGSGKEKASGSEQTNPQQTPQGSQDIQVVQLVTGYVKDSKDLPNVVFRNNKDS
jgi:hypothetical protein